MKPIIKGKPLKPPVANGKLSGKPGPDPKPKSKNKSNPARGFIKDVVVQGKTLKSASVVDLPDYTIGGTRTTRSVLLGDHTSHGGVKGNVIYIHPEGTSITIKSKDGTHHEVNPQDTSSREDGLKKFKKTLAKPTTNSTRERPMTKRERSDLINTLITNGCGCWTEEDRDILRAFEPDRLRNLVANAKASAENEVIINALKAKLGVVEINEELISNMNVTDDDDDDDSGEYGITTNCGGDMGVDESTQQPKKKKKGQPIMNTKEWLNQAPPEIQAVINSAIEVTNTAKAELVSKLVANASKDDADELAELFMGKTLEELKLLVKALPTVNQKQPVRQQPTQQQQQPANRLNMAFFGGQAANGVTTNSVIDTEEFNKDDFLPIPTINFAENN